MEFVAGKLNQLISEEFQNGCRNWKNPRCYIRLRCDNERNCYQDMCFNLELI